LRNGHNDLARGGPPVAPGIGGKHLRRRRIDQPKN
jgi:hypothetical protein